MLRGREYRVSADGSALVLGLTRKMQPTGRTVPRSARALSSDVGQRNVGLCGPQLDGLQLICKSLGRMGSTPFVRSFDGQGPNS
jgi:hypothetical protein